MNLPRLLRTATFGVLLASVSAFAAPRPNVLIIMPDDLSYNDFSHFNAKGPHTPNIDSLARESVRLTDYHVSPTCSPSRASIMTGRYNDETGVWHTIMGRELLRADEVTMPEIFRANGYHTALISKWHLGDNYPLRPLDRGFDYVAAIQGGGADQQPDYWGDTNVSPSKYFVMGKPVALTDTHDGIPGAFSTNFFTDKAIETMKDSAAQNTPFFVYVAYNVAHVPEDMPPDARPGVDAYTGTIENLDKNVGRVLTFLKDSKLEDNTILIFFTDNGEASDLFRAGKSSNYEGGHRVPCFIRWKAGGMAGTESSSREVPVLSSHIDLVPTLMDLLGFHDVANRPAQVPIEGHSLAAALKDGTSKADSALKDRILVVDNQRREKLQKYREGCVMQDETDASGQITHKWRLIRESKASKWELYDIQADQKEAKDLASEKDLGARITAMAAAYESWWSTISARGDEYTRYVLGSSAQPRVILYSHDWHGNFEAPNLPPWNQGMIAAGLKITGSNAVQFSKAGAYTFDLRRWPEEIQDETTLGSALKNPVRHPFKEGSALGVALPIRSARIKVWNGDTVFVDTKEDVDPRSSGAIFTAKVPEGPAMIQTWFYGPDGAFLGGAYYTYVELAKP